MRTGIDGSGALVLIRVTAEEASALGCKVSPGLGISPGNSRALASQQSVWNYEAGSRTTTANSGKKRIENE
jgi:hypothetical protein